MATIDIGKIKPVFKGTYDNSTAYVLDDIVYYNGSSYVAKTSTTGNLPTDATKWNVLASGSGGIWDSTLSLGTANQNVRVNSGATALEFYTPSGGGVLQYKVAVKKDTQTINSSSGVAITGTEVTLTPASASNKILVRGTICFGGDDNLYGGLKIYRKIGSGSYGVITDALGNADGNATRYTTPMQTISGGNSDWKVYSNSFEFLDTPNTTSQVYYQMYSGFYSENSRINEEIQSQDGDHDARPITTLSISELSSTIL